MADRINLFICDIDGTMTNGHMLFDHAGNVSKAYHTRDVTGLYLLQKAGIEVVMVTGSRHTCDKHRFEFLARPGLVFDAGEERPLDQVLIQGVHDKVAVIESILTQRGWTWDSVAMIGDAENDLAALSRVGWAACPKDALDDVKRVANHVMHYPGGFGAVREFGDLIIKTMERVHGTR